MLCAVGPLRAAVPPGSPVADLQAGLPSDWDSPRKPLPVRLGSTSSGGRGGHDHWGLSWENLQSGINLKALTFTCIIISRLALLFSTFMLNFAEWVLLLFNLCACHINKYFTLSSIWFYLKIRFPYVPELLEKTCIIKMNFLILMHCNKPVCVHPGSCIMNQDHHTHFLVSPESTLIAN